MRWYFIEIISHSSASCFTRTWNRLETVRFFCASSSSSVCFFFHFDLVHVLRKLWKIMIRANDAHYNTKLWFGERNICYLPLVILTKRITNTENSREKKDKNKIGRRNETNGKRILKSVWFIMNSDLFIYFSLYFVFSSFFPPICFTFFFFFFSVRCFHFVRVLLLSLFFSFLVRFFVLFCFVLFDFIQCFRLFLCPVIQSIYLELCFRRLLMENVHITLKRLIHIEYDAKWIKITNAKEKKNKRKKRIRWKGFKFRHF